MEILLIILAFVAGVAGVCWLANLWADYDIKQILKARQAELDDINNRIVELHKNTVTKN